jgi:trimethylamine--corrinoid protein Co-methyltransferase
MISDWRNFQQWTAAGGKDATTRANQLWKRALEEYREPLLPPERDEELEAFVRRRIDEGGEKTDF